MMIELKPIGKIITPYNKREEIPRQPDIYAEGEFILEVKKEYQSGLKGLEKHDFITVVFFLDRIADQKFSLKINPSHIKNDNPRGLFATRTPHRPNKIGLSTVKIKFIEEN